MDKMTKQEWALFDTFFTSGVGRYDLSSIDEMELLQKIIVKIKQLKP
jgi:hypothetical protein